LAAPPARAAVSRAAVELLTGGERGAIVDVVSQFLRAYLAGDARQLAYFVPAGVRMEALERRHELVGPVSVGQLSPPGPGARAGAASTSTCITIRRPNVGLE
jgi:hypothetical protein